MTVLASEILILIAVAACLYVESRRLHISMPMLIVRILAWLSREAEAHARGFDSYLIAYRQHRWCCEIEPGNERFSRIEEAECN